MYKAIQSYQSWSPIRRVKEKKANAANNNRAKMNNKNNTK